MVVQAGVPRSCYFAVFVLCVRRSLRFPLADTKRDTGHSSGSSRFDLSILEILCETTTAFGDQLIRNQSAQWTEIGWTPPRRQRNNHRENILSRGEQATLRHGLLLLGLRQP